MPPLPSYFFFVGGDVCTLVLFRPVQIIFQTLKIDFLKSNILHALLLMNAFIDARRCLQSLPAGISSFNLILIILFLGTNSGYHRIITKGQAQWGSFLWLQRDAVRSSKTYGMGIVLLCSRDSSSSIAWPSRLLTSYGSITHFSSIQWFSHEK